MKYEKAKVEVIDFTGRMMVCSETVFQSSYSGVYEFLNTICQAIESWQNWPDEPGQPQYENIFACISYSGGTGTFSFKIQGVPQRLVITSMGDHNSYGDPNRKFPFYQWTLS